MIAVLGPKGGTGKTLTSVQPRRRLAWAGQRVSIVDLDLQFGDVGLALGLKPEQTIYDLADVGWNARRREGRGLPARARRRACAPCSRPRRPDHAGAITVEFVRELFDDAACRWPTTSSSTRPRASRPRSSPRSTSRRRSAWSAMLDALSLKNTKLALETLELMDTTASEHQGRPQPRRQPRRRDAATTCEPARPRPRRPRPSHRDITRSVNEARSDRARPAATRRPRKAFKALAASVRRRRTRRRRRAQAADAAAGCGAGRKAADMELHERLRNSGPARAPRARTDPFAERQEPHPQTVIAELGPQLYQHDIDPRRCAARVLAVIRAQLARGAGLSRDDRERLTEAISDDTLGHGPLEKLLADPTVTEVMVNGPREVWIERDGRLELTRCASPTTRTCAASSTRSSPRSVAGSTRHRRWSTPASRRQPRQRDHPAAVADRAAGHDPQVHAEPARARGLRPARDAHRRSHRVPRALHRRRAQHPRLRRHRLGQDDAAQRDVDGDPGRRPHRHDRGRGRAAPQPAPRAAAGVAARRTSRARARSRSAISSATRCACAPIASSSARSAAPRRWTCSRR